MLTTSTPLPVLSVELETAGSRSTVRMQGALNSSSLAALETQIDQLGCTPCQEVVLEVTQLTDVDAAGAGVLKGLHHYVRARGGRLTIVGAHGPVAAALTSTAPTEEERS